MSIILTASDLPPEAMQAGQGLFRQPIDFLQSVVALDHLPPADRPEVCFAGRSNVGKSSLINAMTRRRKLARTSNTPGRTRELNFYRIGAACHLVDLPGYGYARVSRQQSVHMTTLARDYLSHRTTLQRVFLLIDARHGAKPADLAQVELCSSHGVSVQAILTKIDKVPTPVLAEVTDRVASTLMASPIVHPRILQTSARRHVGLDLLRASIAILT